MLKTAEAITPKHPDKICDRISDTILDECLRQDPESRVAIETMGGHGAITITGELTTHAELDIYKLVKRVLPDWKGIITQNITKQSPEIAQGVDTGGAGDQGIMVGYACDDNDCYIPEEMALAKLLCGFIYYKDHEEDGKTQITINSDKEIVDVVVSFNNVSTKELKKLVKDWLKDKKTSECIKIHINPAGDWKIGSFDADTGVTGRKIVCDAYGPNIPVGGGAFSGKDPTKVDRSAAYMARNVAVHLLEKFNLKNCLVKVAYSIGEELPTMIEVIGTHKDGEIERIFIPKEWFKPKFMIEKLELKKPIYSTVAEWGSFGFSYPWEHLEL